MGPETTQRRLKRRHPYSIVSNLQRLVEDMKAKLLLNAPESGDPELTEKLAMIFAALEEQQSAASQEHGAGWLATIISDCQSRYGNDLSTIAEASEEGSSGPEDARSEAETMPVPDVPDAPPAVEPSVPDPKGQAETPPAQGSHGLRLRQRPMKTP